MTKNLAISKFEDCEMQNTRPVAMYRINRLPVVTRCDAPPNRSTLAKDATMGTTNMAKTCLESRLRDPTPRQTQCKQKARWTLEKGSV